MFSSNPLDKICIGPDCSSGRSNASNRFPVGITSLGDENQQIRIQLAVHKYNSSASTPLNNRCTVISPFRHSFLNNSLKTKNYDGEAEGISKGEKRNGNQYEGVGAFPTIHLKKSAVRYRPIKRFNDTKISYPELPVNRFLSNLPEACSDPKSTTRSVLDVLEDLSGKNIHSKDDNGSNKPKSKGLGGDYLLNQNTVYKPLFVQKPKISSVLTRDNTTQTLSTPDTEAPTSKSNNSFTRNDTSDPRAELRRKLAKQNNEIFASLSSSISSSFSLKRKIDKVTPAGDEESLTDGSATKAPKMDHPNSYNGNGIPKSLSRSKTYSRDSIKTNRKSQLSEANSPTSPNKDRLTTIFLDMQNTSRKSQIFQSVPTLPEADPPESASQASTNLSNGFTSASNGFDNKIPNSLVKGSTGTAVVEEGADKSGLTNSSGLSPVEKPGTDVKKPENEQVSKPVFNFPINITVAQPTPTTFQFGTNNTISSKLGVSKNSIQSNADSVEATKKPLSESNEKKNDQSSDLSKPFAFGNSNEKANFSSFKFGTDGNSSSTVCLAPNDSKTLSSETVQVTATTMPITTPQFCFGANSNATASAPQPLTSQFEVKGTQNILTPPSKPLFAFGQNSTPAQQTSGNGGAEEKTTVPTTSSTTTTQNIQSGPFSFGVKPNADSPVPTSSGQTISSEAGPKNQTTNTLTLSVSNSNPAPVQTSKPVFSFGQKVETPTSTASVNTTQEPKFTFTFGQKPGVDGNKPQQEFGQKSTNLFSFGQKSVPQESQNATTTTIVTSPSQPAITQTTSMFGPNVPQVTSTPQMKFGQMSSPQITNSFGVKSEASTLSSMSTPALSQSSSFPIKTSLFGPSGFGTSNTPTTAGLRTSTSNASSFAFGNSATTQSAPTFGVSSASQTAPTFGGTSTSPTISGFGTPSTTHSTSAFGTSASTPAFGVSVTAQSTTTFPASTTTQSGPSFGATSTTQSVPTFGTASSSQSTPSFGIASTTQSNPTFAVSSAQQSTLGFGTSSTTQSTPAFGASPGFGVPTSSQSNNVFGAPASTQSAVRFGAPLAPNISSFGASTCFSSAPSTQPNTTFGSPSTTSTSGFGTSQSFAQPFNNKPTTSLIPTSSIFGQTPAPSFSSSSTFNSNQNGVFGQKANSEGDMFDQNKIQTQGFGTTSATFGNQNKFPFGMSTSNATNFTTSPPNTTSPPVFSFGSNSTTANTFTFGSGSSMTTNTQTPFAFKSPTNEPFKFGATPATAPTTKDGPGFGGANAGTFNFGGQMNNNNNTMTEQKHLFNFGNAQVSTSGSYAFGTTPSPAVFSFGSSGSASSGSGFNFGTPTPGGGFGQTPSSTPGAPFPVPGTFNIGSGSSQSRPRATSRPRRRP